MGYYPYQIFQLNFLGVKWMKSECVPVRIAKGLYEELIKVGEKTGLSHRFMMDEAVSWWLEVKAPIESQHAEKVRRRRKS